MIKLTTPVGVIYIRKNAIVAFSEVKSQPIKTILWLDGQDDYFNILEDVETVKTLLEQ